MWAHHTNRRLDRGPRCGGNWCRRHAYKSSQVVMAEYVADCAAEAAQGPGVQETPKRIFTAAMTCDARKGVSPNTPWIRRNQRPAFGEPLA